MAATADYLVKTLNAQIIFIPMDLAPNPRDDIVCQDIVQLMNRKDSAIILEGDFSEDDIISIYSLMDLVISLRFHALVFGSMMIVPLIGIHSRGQAKVERLMKALGQDSRCISAENVITNPDCLVSLVKEVWSDREQIQKQLVLQRDFDI